ncbi:hypothetical protein LX81_03407 [Palleronia aestuarii]|uniref:OB-fold protein n=1 Tax=Palleronia aestuarii TaxID=568105 RepID=A0A2W7MYY2_9RHOB|nr:OB-fold domain-containing protein [Palleronia aestuarii]PZX13030.1 hypothetical protein LX81_03407 [Palleronia aestuarii]
MTDTPAMSPTETYRANLAERRLTFQSCRACGQTWMPARSECPNCLSPEFEWCEAGGRATIVSWVVFHVAFDPRYEDRLPYNVALVDLEEGARMVTNIIDLPDGEDVIGRTVTLEFEHDLERELPRFRLAD